MRYSSVGNHNTPLPSSLLCSQHLKAAVAYDEENLCPGGALSAPIGLATQPSEDIQVMICSI
jgi:hypothetical protein